VSAEEFFEEWVGDNLALWSHEADSHIVEMLEAYASRVSQAERKRADAAENDLMRIGKALNQPGTQLVPIADRAIAELERLRERADRAEAELAKCGRENCFGHYVEGCRQWVSQEALDKCKAEVERLRKELARSKRDFARLTELSKALQSGQQEGS